GPEKGGKVPALKVHDVTGEHKDKEVDYTAQRKDKPTVYFLIAADKFDRPMNRFMKTLDQKMNKDYEGVYIVAVWLTADLDKTKEFLPRVQMSVNYASTALTAFKGAEGPRGWNANSDAHLTVVIANKGKVVTTMGYKSINETDVKGVLAALKKTVGKKE
ncbi:MAG TPA: hypothetical protein VN688_01920, partial [Gemmataceae bacterium]|nr:hypothetical protein [Gemmataceae bacterium]